MENVVIIGNGISGTTAARWIRKLSNCKITIISSETDYFYSRTALMYIYMGHMRFVDTKPYEDDFWNKNSIDLLNDHVISIDHQSASVKTKSGNTINYDHLILALGSRSNKFGWPGQDLDGVRGLYSIQDVLEMEKHSHNLKRAVVVGGGLIGIEMAEMFRSRNIPVSLIVREKNYWDNVLPEEEAQMVTRHIRDHHIDLHLNSNLKEILDDGNGKVSGIVIKESGERIDCGFVGLTPGVSPNIEFLKGTELNIDRGILVDNFLKTNIKNVYAIGDCVQLTSPKSGRKAIEPVWYTGRMMGETVAYNVCGSPVEYNPGLWFNSAKFLDIEYQIYGNVPNNLGENEDSFYWEHEDGDKSLRIVFEKSSHSVTGFNLMGIRFRHEVCEKWIKEKTHLHEVLSNLSLANFDPEFYEEHEPKIIDAFNKKHATSLTLSKARSPELSINFIKQ